MKNRGVAVYNGSGKLTTNEEVKIEPSGELLKGKFIVVATGANPQPLPGTAFGPRVLSYRDALQLQEVPSRSVIVGAGPIGMEFATLWKRYGSDVTVIEMMPRLLPLEDEAVGIEAERQFKRIGIKVLTSARVEEITSTDKEVKVTVSAGEENKTITADNVLVCIGFKPGSGRLGLKNAGVDTTTHAYIIIDDQMRTNVPNIFAIGDVTGKLGLAHVTLQPRRGEHLVSGKHLSATPPDALVRRDDRTGPFVAGISRCFRPRRRWTRSF